MLTSTAARPADTATDAQPDSEEKIAVLTERAAQRRELWHAEDGPSQGRDG
jgi:hypothetical protein